ncbi:Phosphomannomutase/phosphoglucomutase [Chromobacterium violaceum]|uniref:Phosphomannomutase/phosphoglucomutase n=1 Tax=Chromobacterium violaceum TaxID=536 RepID=A0A3S4HR22_CHRVL|nr:Phosphomannomutase/phosphoglucomutase [Chromobacterium violaceum]
MNKISKDIFKAYDIRGIVGKTLTAAVARQIGQAVASEAIDRKVKAIVIGRDGRLSGRELSEALAEGIRAAGVDVIDVGRVATPMLYFAAISWAPCPA